MSKRPVVVIAGPTASGKSDLACAVAERFGGVVVNGDSLQLYRDLRILTARPTDADMARAAHRLYGVLAADSRCSAGEWARMASGEIDRCGSRLPVVVGGSGLYLEALLRGLHRIPETPAALRSQLRERLGREGAERLHAELTARDPLTAGRIPPGDSQRLVRALEVLLHTGRGLAAWWADGAAGGPAGLDAFTVTVMPPRGALHAACDRRLEAMLAAGALEEVARFVAMDPPPDSPLWRAVGVRPIADFIAGGIGRGEMVARVQRDTRRYAKRQRTWFRHRTAAALRCGAASGREREDVILPGIERFLLTAAV